MISALAFVVFQSWKNRLTMRIRRLKQPKYLVGGIVGGLYFYYYFFRLLFNHGNVGVASPGMSPENAALFESAGALVLGTIVLLAWVIPHQRAALVFSEAEIAFLFPAPVDRRTLIHWKLLKSQIGILFTTVLFTLLFRRSMTGSPAWIRAVGWWVILSTLNLHFLGSSFARTMLLERGIATWKRRVAVLAVAALAAGAVFVWAEKTIPHLTLNQSTTAADLKYYFQKVTESGPLPWLLLPFRQIVRPYLSADAAEFFKAVWPALVLMALHYWWVVRSNVAFEEASVEASQKMAERVATIRANRGQFVSRPTKKKRPPFRLRPTGLPAVALLWKNLIGAGSAFTLRFWLLLIWLAVISVFASAAGRHTFNLAVFAGTMSLMFLGMSFLIGPQLVRQDFRQDLPMADVLKACPLAGWQVALGELLAPAVILTGVQWLLIVLSAGLTGDIGKLTLPSELRLAIAGGLAMVAPMLNAVTLIIPNAAVLLFPGWFQTGKDAPQGIEAMGQRLIFALGQVVVFALALVPAALVFAVVLLVAQWFAGLPVSILLASAVAAVVMAGEAWLGLLWLGRLFERLDLSAESGA
jgi:ABC-2 type transport system permease protein